MASVTWCLAFPYAPNEPIRESAWQIVTEFYTHNFPDVPQLVHSATPVGEPFLRSKTRNELVRMAEAFDIICLIDADTLIHPDGIRRTLTAVADADGLLGKPFLRGTNLPLDAQRTLAAGDLGWPQARFNDPGASWVVRPETWWRAGGMDENFTGWGGEDESFNYMHAAIGGTTFDTFAAVKTEHPQPRWSGAPDWADTYKREAVYRQIWQHPELATEWLAVRDQPGIVDVWIEHLGISHAINTKLEAQARRQAHRARRDLRASNSQT